VAAQLRKPSAVTREELAALVRYDRAAGHLYWLPRDPSSFKHYRFGLAWNAKFAGKRAFNTDNSSRYLYGWVLGARVKAHRVIWLLEYGVIPDVVDHINGDYKDNRISNLRSVDAVLNGRNCKRSRANSSGVTGVSWCKRDQKWQARVQTHKGQKFLGRFTRIDDAIAVRKAAEAENLYHPNHGRVTPLPLRTQVPA